MLLTHEPHITAGSALVVVAFNVDFKRTMSDIESRAAAVDRDGT